MNCLNKLQSNKLLWRCVYCDDDFSSMVALKMHFIQHKDKRNYNNGTLRCPCGKYFSELHYFENHLLQTGHRNDMPATSEQSNPRLLSHVDPRSTATFNEMSILKLPYVMDIRNDSTHSAHDSNVFTSKSHGILYTCGRLISKCPNTGM